MDSLPFEPPGSPAAATAAKSLQSCPTLCDPRDGHPPGSPVPGILQGKAKILEWVAIFFSKGSSQPRDRTGSPAFQADALTSAVSWGYSKVAMHGLLIVVASLAAEHRL